MVLLSVPGPAVLGEALDAIDAGRHVMIFSDNVPVGRRDRDEGRRGRRRGAGDGPGLRHRDDRRGRARLRERRSAARAAVGVVAASGTGAQQLTCLLDEAGVARVPGAGGRRPRPVGGGRRPQRRAALRMLDADPATDHIVLISKPPHPAAADRGPGGGAVTSARR